MMPSRAGGYGARRTQVILCLALLATSLIMLSVTPSAFATPKGEFAVFADCPVTSVNACIYAKTESGEFTVGKKTVPIEKAITLQGGLKEVEEGARLEFVGAVDGNTLSKTPQKVPGGLSGLVNCTEIKGSGLLEKAERASCEAIFENGLTGVTATTELAAPASSIGINLGNLLAESGTALSLPVKVHLENPLFGSSCYVGSNSHPIVIELTTGTTSPPLPNKPIKGKTGTLEFKDGGLLVVKNNSLVNNSFAAPEVNGCGGIFSFLINPIVDASLGVPSAAGHNTAILNGTLEQAGAENVKEHE
jgi:hypothetical protein